MPPSPNENSLINKAQLKETRVSADEKYKALAKIEAMAEELYKHGDAISHGEAWARQRSYIWGYAEAAKSLCGLDGTDIQRVIDRAHERIYGESREARIERLRPKTDDAGAPDWDSFDTPTYERKSADQEQAKSGMRSFKIPPAKYSPTIRKYIDTFGHRPSAEAMKWKSDAERDKLAKMALNRGKPIKEWAERPFKKLGIVTDGFYATRDTEQ